MTALRDRYTQAFGLVLLGIILFIFLRDKSRIVGAVLGIIGFGYLAWLSTRPGRRNNFQKKPEDIFFFKGESDCGFTEELLDDIDGIMYKENIYKIVNGVDVVVAGSNQVDYATIKPAGPGSWIMQKIGGGGYLSMPPDDCWRYNPWRGQGTVIESDAPRSTPE